MPDPLSLIYYELWQLQIPEYPGNFEDMVQKREFATGIAQNISDLEGQP